MTNRIYLTEILPKRFYFGTVSNFIPPSDERNIYVTVDNVLDYRINSYFGPPCISDIYKYCELIATLLRETDRSQRIVHLTSFRDAEKCTNSVFLVGSFLVLGRNMSPKQAVKKLKNIKRVNLIPYCDTTSLKSAPTLRMKYFFQALHKACAFGWFSLSSFDVGAYDQLCSPEGGDMNWILPGKFLAFSDPFGRIGSGFADLYIDYFRENGVTTVIRCNDPKYDAEVFQRKGIVHHDLYFDDGSAPTQIIVEKFLYVAELTRGAIAIHCKAGMGRTGTLIAAYMVKHYPSLSSLEATAWLRLCRPGSIIGYQQHFLEINELWLKQNRPKYKRRYDETYY